jgi:hypothetical protein
MDIRKFDSYSTEAVIIVGAASCLTYVLIVFLYFWLVLDVVGRHHSYGVMQTSDLLTASLWSLAATAITSAVIGMAARPLKYFPPSWLAIPIASTFAFIFSLAIFLHWLSVRSYSPTSPFRQPPPHLADVLSSALLTSVCLSVLTVAVVFVVYVQWVGRDEGKKLQITA